MLKLRPVFHQLRVNLPFRHCCRGPAAARKSVSTACAKALAVLACQAVRGQQLQIVLGRHVAEFDQHRGHVRRRQNLEAGRLQRMLVQARRALELAHHVAGKQRRIGLGLALRQIDQDIGDVVGLGGQIDAGDDVGFVLGLGQPRGFRVRGILRQRIDGSALGLALAACGIASAWIEMNSAALCARPKRTRSLSGMNVSSERVIATRYLPVPLKPLPQFLRELQHDVLFHLAARRPARRCRCRHGRDRARSAGGCRRRPSAPPRCC